MGNLLKNLTSKAEESGLSKKLIIEFDTLHYAAVQTKKIPDTSPVTGDLTLKFDLDHATPATGAAYYHNTFEYDENINWVALPVQTTTVYVNDHGDEDSDSTQTAKPKK